MNERIRELRKYLGITLEKLGEHLGVGKSTLSQIENGKSGITEQMIKSICREFNVNEEWLRTGNGNMFKPIIDEVSAAASDITDSDDYLIQDLIVVYQSLSQASKDALKELAKGMYIRQREREKEEDGGQP